MSDYSDHHSDDGNHCSNDDDHNNDDDVFNISQITTELVNSPQTREPDVTSSYNHAISAIEAKSTSSASVMDNLNLKKTLDIGDADLPIPSVFQSSKRHADASPEDLSERWFISIKQATKTLKNTAQRFLRSALLPLSRRYRADRTFQMKRLTGVRRLTH